MTWRRPSGARGPGAGAPAPRGPLRPPRRCRCRPSACSRAGPPGSALNAISPRAARSRLAAVSARRVDRAVAHDGAGGRRQARRRSGHQDRGVVEVDGVAAVRQPAQEPPADERERHERRDEQPQHRVELPGELERPGVRRRRVGVDLGEGREQRAVQVAPSSSGSMSFSKIAWRSSLDRKVALVPGARVQLDLAVAGVRPVEVEQDDEPVVERPCARRPTGPSARSRRCSACAVGDAVGDELRVDDDLAPVRGLDRRRSSPATCALVAARKTPAVS